MSDFSSPLGKYHLFERSNAGNPWGLARLSVGQRPDGPRSHRIEPEPFPAFEEIGVSEGCRTKRSKFALFDRSDRQGGAGV
jgi:hypothetical protein